MSQKLKEKITLIYIVAGYGVMFLIIALGLIFPGNPPENQPHWYIWAMLVAIFVYAISAITIIGVSNRMDKRIVAQKE